MGQTKQDNLHSFYKQNCIVFLCLLWIDLKGRSGLSLTAQSEMSLVKIFRPWIKKDEQLYSGPERLMSYSISRNWIIIMIKHMAYSSNDVKVIWEGREGVKNFPAAFYLASNITIYVVQATSCLRKDERNSLRPGLCCTCFSPKTISRVAAFKFPENTFIQGGVIWAAPQAPSCALFPQQISL